MIIKEITLEWLKEKNACSEAVELFKNQDETEPITVLKKLADINNWNWANWLIVRLMNYQQFVSYAVFAAEQVIEIYEKKYPIDQRPRLAIESAKKCIDNPSQENKSASAAASAASSAASAAASASSASSAAYASITGKINKWMTDHIKELGEIKS